MPLSNFWATFAFGAGVLTSSWGWAFVSSLAGALVSSLAGALTSSAAGLDAKNSPIEFPLGFQTNPYPKFALT